MNNLNPQLVYILGSGYCGSTLLNRLLNGHSQVIGLSEIFIVRHFSTSQWEKLFERSDLWQLVEKKYQEKYNISLINAKFPDFSWSDLIKQDSKQLHESITPYMNLFNCVSEEFNSPLLVDASKTPKQLFFYKKGEIGNLKVIHLIRDGRAVLYSYIKTTKYNARVGINRWLKTNLASLVMKNLFNSENWLNVRYESLCLEPEKYLTEICQFLNIEYEPKMLNFFSHQYMGLSGNPNVKKAKREERIVLDTRWQNELSSQDLLKFNLTAGWLNKLYNY